MSHFSNRQIDRIKARARENAVHDDNLRSFLHSTIYFAFQEENQHLVAEMKITDCSGRDGAFRGLVLINELAELLEVAILEREKFLRDRAENDKSG